MSWLTYFIGFAISMVLWTIYWLLTPKSKLILSDCCEPNVLYMYASTLLLFWFISVPIFVMVFFPYLGAMKLRDKFQKDEE